jgi:anti-sigma regulatory factor (Ser/Thr protein kinase)
VNFEDALSAAATIGDMPLEEIRAKYGQAQAMRAARDAGLPARLPARPRGTASPAPAPTPLAPAPRPATAISRPGGRYTRTDLTPGPRAAAQARAFTRATLNQWDLGHLAPDAEAIAAELLANASAAAIPAARPFPAIIFSVHDRPPELRIFAWDNGPGHPQPASAGPDAETGRGLAIISALSRQWGWWPTPGSGGKVVWASVPTATGPG